MTYTDWDQLPESADKLFSKNVQDSLFFSRQWFHTLTANALKDDESLLLACVLDQEKILAILPLIKNNTEYWDSLSSYYSSLFTLLLDDHDPQKVLTYLVSGLNQLSFKQLRLYPVAKNDKALEHLQKIMKESEFQCYRSLRFFNWYQEIQNQSFETYMAARPSKVRNTIARKQRKLEREQGYDIRLFMDGDLEHAITDYKKIYAASWKGNEAFSNFVEELVHNLAKLGWLRLAILYIKDEPAAAQIWFVVHGKASIFRLAYDEKWWRYSTGSILTRYLMEYVIDTDKVKEIDYLTGNDQYKKDWMSQRRERFSLCCIKNEKSSKEKSNIFALILKKLKNIF